MDTAEDGTTADTLRPADLALLRELIGEARVVALGEGAHNITEFYGLRDRLFRFLVRECGFTGLVLESGFAEGLSVDAWAKGGPGQVETVARDGITYRFGECAPMWRQLRWIRRHNSGGAAKVGFYGMDLPGSSTSPGPAVRACLDRLPPRKGDGELLRLSDLGDRSQAAVRYAALSAADRARLLDGLRELGERALHFSQDSAHADPEAETALWCAASLEAFVAEAEADAVLLEEPYPREEFMARSVEWILRRERRIVVSAHNGHVRREPLDGRPTLGGLLSASLGDDLVVIGMTYGSGPEVHFAQRSPRPFDWDVTLGTRTLPPWSLESRLDRLGPETSVLAPRRAPAGFFDGVAGTLAHGELEPVEDFPAAYDAIIHVRRVSRIPGAFERLRAEFAAASPAPATAGHCPPSASLDGTEIIEESESP